MGRDGTIVLAAAGAAATTMHNDGLSARCYCRAPQTVSSRRTAEKQRARARQRPTADQLGWPMDFRVRVNPAAREGGMGERYLFIVVLRRCFDEMPAGTVATPRGLPHYPELESNEFKIRHCIIWLG